MLFMSEMMVQIHEDGLTIQKTWSRPISYPGGKKDRFLLHIISKINWGKK